MAQSVLKSYTLVLSRLSFVLYKYIQIYTNILFARFQFCFLIIINKILNKKKKLYLTKRISPLFNSAVKEKYLFCYEIVETLINNWTWWIKQRGNSKGVTTDIYWDAGNAGIARRSVVR